MTGLLLVGGVLGAALVVYVAVALLFPEHLS